jgi:Leucine-rich repeat (LRR) protein
MLKFLSIELNQIKEIEDVKHLPRLKEIDLFKNPLSLNSYKILENLKEKGIKINI